MERNGPNIFHPDFRVRRDRLGAEYFKELRAFPGLRFIRPHLDNHLRASASNACAVAAQKARTHFAVIRLRHGNSSCGKKCYCLATNSTNEVPAYSGAERNRREMELDLSLLAGFRHASVQRTAPVNALDFP